MNERLASSQLDCNNSLACGPREVSNSLYSSSFAKVYPESVDAEDADEKESTRRKSENEMDWEPDGSR